MIQWLCVAFTFFLPLCSQGQHNDSLLIKNGFLDLSAWQFADNGIVDLNGHWEFFPEVFLRDPSALCRTNPLFVPVGREIREKKREKRSYFYGTYHVRIKLPRRYPPLALRIPEHGGAMEIAVNGRTIVRIGRIGKSREESAYGSYPQVVPLPQNAPELDIYINASHFHHFNKSKLKTLRIGSLERLIQARKSAISFHFLVLGGVLILGLYHLFLSALARKKALPSMYLAAMCFAFIGRSLLVGEAFLQDIVGHIPWNIRYRLISFALVVGFVSIYQYIKESFHDPLSNTITRCGQVVFLAILPVILFAHTDIIFYASYIGHFAAVFLAVYCPIVLIRNLKSDRKGSISFFIGFTFFMASALVELISFYLFDCILYVSNIGFSLFILILSFNDSAKFQHYYALSGKLSDQLRRKESEILRILKQTSPPSPGKPRLSKPQFEAFCRTKKLTKRESQVLKCIARGVTNRDMADKLNISYHTVRRHLSAIYQKTGENTRDSLLQMMNREEILEHEAKVVNGAVNVQDAYVLQPESCLEVFRSKAPL
jgi:DNA-binding CsgD family transcriptional regulator